MVLQYNRGGFKVKKRKCKICKKRVANERHAKDYNHANIKMPGNCVRLDNYCHKAFHILNKRNFLDWGYMIQNKKQEIINRADRLEKKDKSK